jgi:hypothetical protein
MFQTKTERLRRGRKQQSTMERTDGCRTSAASLPLLLSRSSCFPRRCCVLLRILWLTHPSRRIALAVHASCCLFVLCVACFQVSTKPVRVNRHVLERQSWEKFGDCKGVPRGPEQNITYQSFEIIHLDLRPKKREEEKDDGALESKLAGTSSIVVCRSTNNTRIRTRAVFTNQPLCAQQ